MSFAAEYVTSGGHEIKCGKTDQGLWHCWFYKGGELPAVLKGVYLTKSDLHRAIVGYLKTDNVLGKAKWPK